MCQALEQVFYLHSIIYSSLDLMREALSFIHDFILHFTFTLYILLIYFYFLHIHHLKS